MAGLALPALCLPGGVEEKYERPSFSGGEGIYLAF